MKKKGLGKVAQAQNVTKFQFSPIVEERLDKDFGGGLPPKEKDNDGDDGGKHFVQSVKVESEDFGLLGTFYSEASLFEALMEMYDKYMDYYLNEGNDPANWDAGYNKTYFEFHFTNGDDSESFGRNMLAYRRDMSPVEFNPYKVVNLKSIFSDFSDDRGNLFVHSFRGDYENPRLYDEPERKLNLEAIERRKKEKIEARKQANGNYDGSKYNSNLSQADIGKLVKKEVLAKYPKSNISVLTPDNSINVYLKDTGFNPYSKEYIEFVNSGANLNDWNNGKGYWDRKEKYNEKALKFAKDVEQMLNAYNYDHSDRSGGDTYWSVNFYDTVSWQDDDLMIQYFPNHQRSLDALKNKAAEKEWRDKRKARADERKKVIPFEYGDLVTTKIYFRGGKEETLYGIIKKVPNGQSRFSLDYDIKTLKPVSEDKVEELKKNEFKANNDSMTKRSRKKWIYLVFIEGKPYQLGDYYLENRSDKQFKAYEGNWSHWLKEEKAKKNAPKPVKETKAPKQETSKPKTEINQPTETLTMTKKYFKNSDVTIAAKENLDGKEKGLLTIQAFGNTKPHKDFLKEKGVKVWDNDKKIWWTKFGTVAEYEAVIAYFNGLENGDSISVSKGEPERQPKPAIDERVKLAEQWQKVADSTQKKSDDLSSKLANKATHTRRMMEQYMHAKTTQEKWSDVADAAQVVADGLANKTIDGEILELIKRLKPMVGSDPYDNPLYPFCKYRYYSGYGGRNENIQWNYQNRKPDGFKLEECVLMNNFIQGKSTREPENPKQAELDKMVREVKFGSIEGFFPTPPSIIEQMIELADLGSNQTILEPSAGIGSIVDAIKNIGKGNKIYCVEQNYTLAKILELKGYNVKRGDFLDLVGKQFDGISQYDRILMNPPFEKGQDAIHIQHAFSLLRPGGKLVAIAGEGIFFRNDKIAVGFRDFLEKHDGYSERLPQDAFNGKDAFRKTGVATRLVVLEKEGNSNVTNVQKSNVKAIKLNYSRLKTAIEGFNSELDGSRNDTVVKNYFDDFYQEFTKGIKEDELKQFFENDGIEEFELMAIEVGIKKQYIDGFMFILFYYVRGLFGVDGYTYSFLKYHLSKLELT